MIIPGGNPGICRCRKNRRVTRATVRAPWGGPMVPNRPKRAGAGLGWRVPPRRPRRVTEIEARNRNCLTFRSDTRLNSRVVAMGTCRCAGGDWR